MSRAACLVAVVALGVSPVIASPVTRSCGYKGPANLDALTVTLDEVARSVKVEFAGGVVYTYRDGARGSMCATPPAEPLTECDLMDQFVTIRADRVEVGLRNRDDGLTAHVAYFPRAAFANSRVPCVWRSSWNVEPG